MGRDEITGGCWNFHRALVAAGHPADGNGNSFGTTEDPRKSSLWQLHGIYWIPFGDVEHL